jgi:HAD superfamily hydrolase (TIGR01509 family)
MIRAVIFDLDGTLVQTERLKALSYARAAVELRHDLTETDVVEAFKSVVGRSRDEVALALMKRFDLERAARMHMSEFGVSAPWQVFVQLRLRHYEAMLVDPEVLWTSQWPHNVALLHAARQSGCKTGLASMSHGDQVRYVLEVLGLKDAFDVIAARDDVEHGKPDPEIYLLVAHQLHVSPEECLVIEDSPVGVEAALAAGMSVIAVTTPFTREQFHEVDLVDRRWVVDDPETLPDVVRRMIEAHNQQREGGTRSTG